jgi:hypothetical protein
MPQNVAHPFFVKINTYITFSVETVAQKWAASEIFKNTQRKQSPNRQKNRPIRSHCSRSLSPKLVQVVGTSSKTQSVVYYLGTWCSLVKRQISGASATEANCVIHVVCMRYVCGMYVVCMWYVCGMYVVCMWYVCGMYVVCMWYVSGMYMVCMWYVYGMYMVCMWYTFIRDCCSEQ